MHASALFCLLLGTFSFMEGVFCSPSWRADPPWYQLRPAPSRSRIEGYKSGMYWSNCGERTRHGMPVRGNDHHSFSFYSLNWNSNVVEDPARSTREGLESHA